MFEVAFETTFCATHVLTRSGMPLEPVHGHDWRVEVVAGAAELDECGVALDFERLKDALREVVGVFHYADLNAQPVLAGQSPSAEVVARHVFQAVRQRLGPQGALLRRVRVWEAPGCSAAYSE